MKRPELSALALSAAFLLLASPSLASQCIECHTNPEKLKTIAANLPKPVASAETAGKG